MSDIKWEHECDEHNAAKFLDWIRNRGGVAVWQSVNLGNPGASWSGPMQQANGDPSSKPNWESDTKPASVHTDATKIGVYSAVLVETIPAKVKVNGMQMVLTSGTTRRLTAALRRVEKSHGNSFYRKGSSMDPELYIFTSGPMVSLQEWADAQDTKEAEVA